MLVRLLAIDYRVIVILDKGPPGPKPGRADLFIQEAALTYRIRYLPMYL